MSWYVINASYVIGEKNSKQKPTFTDRGVPQFFYELVQYCVAFELVKNFTKYGLGPTFNENLKDWSLDLHCIVQLLSKTTQTKEDKERATKYIDTLFDNNRTENWGHFGQTEFGNKSHLQKMSNFALPLVILTWWRMLFKHFHDNSDETFLNWENIVQEARNMRQHPLIISSKGIRLKRVGKHKFLALSALRSRRNCLFFNGQITFPNKTLIWRLPVRKKQDLERLKINQ